MTITLARYIGRKPSSADIVLAAVLPDNTPICNRTELGGGPVRLAANINFHYVSHGDLLILLRETTEQFDIHRINRCDHNRKISYNRLEYWRPFSFKLANGSTFNVRRSKPCFRALHAWLAENPTPPLT